MAYRPLNDLIDPDVPAAPDPLLETLSEEAEEEAAEFVIGDDGRRVVNLGMSEALGRRMPGPKPWAKPAALALMILFAGLTAWNLTRVGHVTSVVPQATPFQVKQALYLGTMKVEAYRKVHGVVPASLNDAGIADDSGYAYDRIDPTRYVLVFEADGQKVQYDSKVELERVFGSPKQMLTMGGSR